MEGNYEVFCGGLAAGKAEATRQGLYYKFVCHCKADGEAVHRLVVRWKDGWENLGVPIPDRDGLFLSKRVAIKRIGEGPYVFILMPLCLDPEQFLFPETKQSEDEDWQPDLKEDTLDDQEAPEAEGRIQDLKDMDMEQQRDSSASIPEHADMEEIFEDKAFFRLEELENARFAIVNSQPVAVFYEEDTLDIQQETHGAVIGAQDLRVDGSGLDETSQSV